MLVVHDAGDGRKFAIASAGCPDAPMFKIVFGALRFQHTQMPRCVQTNACTPPQLVVATHMKAPLIQRFV